MRFFTALALVFLFSCAKEQQTVTDTQHTDSLQAMPEKDSLQPADSGVVLPPVPQYSVAKPFRYTDGDSIVQIINSDMIPLSLTDEFTREGQLYVIKIKNFDRQNISGEIHPAQEDMNLRFNQVRLPDGSFDGPFGRKLQYKVRGSGDLWLLLGRSNMASGKDTGSFRAKLR